MLTFEYHLPVNLIFGRGSAERIGTETALRGHRALLVTGGTSTRRSGLLGRAQEQLRQAGVSATVFDRVTPNPLTTTVAEGAELASREACDVIVALGGGSSIDTAKGIAFQCVNAGDINDYIFGRRQSSRALPVIAVPTTCGTGSEGNGFAVLTNPDTMDKKSLRCTAIVPACSIIDPLLMTTMPKTTLAPVGFDALCHGMEAYLSKPAQPITQMQALECVELAGRGMTAVWRDPSDLDGWDALCLASTLGGMVIGVSGVTAPHGMEHPASGLKNIVHGRGLAALTIAVTRHTLPYGKERYAALAARLALPGGDLVSQLDLLREELGLTEGLSSFGVTERDVPWMAENCEKVSIGGLRAHPKFFDRAELEEIYREAL